MARDYSQSAGNTSLEDRSGDELAFAGSIVEGLRQPVVLLDTDLNVRFANECFCQTFCPSRDACQGLPLYALSNHQWDVPPLHHLLEELVSQRSSVQDFEWENTFHDLGRKVMLLNARRIFQNSGDPGLIVLGIEDITEQRPAAKAVDETEYQWQFILDAAPALIGYIGSDLRYRLANHAYERWFGMPVKSLIGKSMSELFGEEMCQTLSGHLQTVLSGKTVSFEADYPNGRTLTVTYTPDFDEHGSVRGFVVLGSDATDRKSTERQLRESERRQAVLADLGEQLREIGDSEALIAAALEIVGSELNVSHAGYCRVDEQGQFVTSKQQREADGVRSLPGCYPLDNLLSDRLKRGELVVIADVASDPITAPHHTHWESLGIGALVIAPLFEQGRLAALLYVHDAAPRTWSEVEITFIRKAADRAWAAAERAQALLQLQHSEEFTRSILSSTPDSVNVLTLQGRLLAINEGGCRQMEIDDVQPYLNQPWSDLWGESSQVAALALQQAAEGRTSGFEGFCPTAKGTPKWWDVVVTPVRDATGKPVRLLSLCHDITERRQADHERERLTQELRRSNEDLSQFAHTVAHDLQTPLRGVVTFGQLLQRKTNGRLTAEELEFLDQIVQSGRRMRDLVQALLRFAQVGQGEIEKRCVNMEQVLDAALQTVQWQIEEQGATISRHPLPAVLGDSVQLVQLLQNLIGNALKYRRDEAPPHVRIEARQHDGHFVFSVQDNGEGIAPEHLQVIFEPLKRLHGVEIAGDGLGLATCQRIVSRHGGRLWVESQLGVGSTFSFSLPTI